MVLLDGRPVSFIAVDDNLEVAECWRTFLRPHIKNPLKGWIDPNPEAFRKRIASTPVDFVITDFNMAGGGGAEVLQVLADNYPNVGVVVVTAHRISAIGAACAAIHANAKFMTAPVDIFELVDVVEEVVNGAVLCQYDLKKGFRWNGLGIPLTRNAAQLMQALHRRRDEGFIPSEELVQVFDTGQNIENLRAHVKMIRDLFKRAGIPEIIENEPKNGYRLSDQGLLKKNLPDDLYRGRTRPIR